MSTLFSCKPIRKNPLLFLRSSSCQHCGRITVMHIKNALAVDLSPEMWLNAPYNLDAIGRFPNVCGSYT